MDKKIGTLFGVFIPNVTMMFGAILFLRLGPVSGHAGMLTILGVLGFSLLIMSITSASIASMATNMEVGAGGVYYLITRTLGVEIGGALGLATYLSQLLSLSLTVSGFSFYIVELFPNLSLTGVEVGTLAVLSLISSSSAKFALKIQGVIMIVLILSIVAIFFGSPRNITTPVGPPLYPGGTLGFWASFGLIYPAVTGIEAGMALSGALKDPGKSLSFGNMSSLIFVGICYVAIAVFAILNIPHDVLISNPLSFNEYSHFSSLIMVGIFVATLSSALGSLLGAPRMLQCLADDGILFSFLGKTYGPMQEPRISLALTSVLTAIIMIYTTIDNIIPMLTIICLINYLLLNFVSALGTLMNAPSWRPQFKVSYLISFLGVILIVVAMMKVNLIQSAIAVLIIILFYALLKRRNLSVSFSDFRGSIIFFFSRMALYRLSQTSENSLSWHPKILVLSSGSLSHPKTAWVANAIARQCGLLTFTSVVPEDWGDAQRIEQTRSALESFYTKQEIPCLAEVQMSNSPKEGLLNLIKAYGIGPIRPNTVLIPLDEKNVISDEVIELIKCCQLNEKNVILVKDDVGISEEVFSQRLYSEQKRLDIYWDSNNRESFAFLLNIVKLMTDSVYWSDARVTLKSIVEIPEAAAGLGNYLKEFVKKDGLKMKVKIFTQEEQDSISTGAKTHLFAVPFRKIEEDESMEDYFSYLSNHTESFAESGVGLFVCSMDKVFHHENYKLS